MHGTRAVDECVLFLHATMHHTKHVLNYEYLTLAGIKYIFEGMPDA